MSRRAVTVGVYAPRSLPESFRVYLDGVIGASDDLDVTYERFERPAARLAGFDVIWEPTCGGGKPPPQALLTSDKPLVPTLHGLAPMALRPWQYHPDTRSMLKGIRDNRRKRRRWRDSVGRLAAVITVSEFVRMEAIERLGLPPGMVHACLHGVDVGRFRPAAKDADRRYLLHISNDEPRKNVRTILAAYARLAEPVRPALILKLPETSRRTAPPGVEIIRRRLDDAEIARLYAGAVAFLFPSSYEGFGLPILEAMAAGCPVITADGTACAEVAGEAALMTRPRDAARLAGAVRRLLEDGDLRLRLVHRGFERAGSFTWRTSAERHARIFRRVANAARTG